MHVPFSKWHLGDDCLEGLKRYQYSGTDLSLTSKYVLQRYWRWLVEFLPRWLAPNMVTLLGLACLMLSYSLVSWYSPECRSTVPGWVWALTGTAVFAYQTLDALDGKQARRTGSSSPLGELFDHGCDAIGMILISLNTVSCLMLTQEQMPFGLFYMTVMPGGFFLSAWEQYHTGTLCLGYVNGPVEGLLFLSGFFLVTAGVGSHFWSQTEVLDVPLSLWLLLIPAAASVGTFYGNVTNVLAGAEAGGARTSPMVTVAPLLVMAGCLVCFGVSFPEYVLGPGFRTIGFAYGLAIANACAQFVIARVCNVLERIHPRAELPTVGFPVGVAVYIVLPIFLSPESAAALRKTFPVYMSCYCILLALLYVHVTLSVCERISQALDIGILSLTPRQVDKAMALAAGEQKKD